MKSWETSLSQKKKKKKIPSARRFNRLGVKTKHTHLPKTPRQLWPRTPSSSERHPSQLLQSRPSLPASPDLPLDGAQEASLPHLAPPTRVSPQYLHVGSFHHPTHHKLLQIFAALFPFSTVSVTPEPSFHSSLNSESQVHAQGRGGNSTDTYWVWSRQHSFHQTGRQGSSLSAYNRSTLLKIPYSHQKDLVSNYLSAAQQLGSLGQGPLSGPPI